MTDNLSRQKRSRVMSSIKGKDTRPELTIRRILWQVGVRYRVHDNSIPGTPDISNKTMRVEVFIDGCFWHGCPTCYKPPLTNPRFWREKLTANRHRRHLVLQSLAAMGWTTREFWEHDVKRDPSRVAQEIARLIVGPAGETSAHSDATCGGLVHRRVHGRIPRIPPDAGDS